VDLVEIGRQLALAGIFTLFGVVMFLLGYLLVERFMPFDLRKELIEDDNPAVGAMLAGIFIGLAIIIAAAIS
jgi:putative membrane protein